MGRQTYKQADIQADRQANTHKQIDLLADRCIGGEFNRGSDGQIDRLTDICADRHIGRQTYGKTDIWEDRHMGRYTYGQTDTWVDRHVGRQTYGQTDMSR
jgi:hypothetical protein